MRIRPLVILLLMISLLTLADTASAAPFWGAKESSSVNTPLAQLKPGEWIWAGEVQSSGPIAVVVSLSEQRAYAYRNGLLIGVTTISSGKPGHETPTGVFTILQKDKDHHSNVYNNASMPYMQRLTWGGVALHAGGLPGYPESHGCVHLPSAFAQQLYAVSPMGMTVVVARERESPVDVVHPSAMTPIDAKSGAEVQTPRLSKTEEFRWQPELAPEGPVSVLISGADQRLLVMRNGIEIGRARIDILNPEKPLGTHVFIIKDGIIPGVYKPAPDLPIPRWTAIGVPGNEAEKDRTLTADAVNRIVLPQNFLKQLNPLLQPGVTLLLTDAAVLPQTTGVHQQVIDSDSPEGE